MGRFASNIREQHLEPFSEVYLPISMRNKTDDLEQRADLISAAIARISEEIKQIEATGVVAPPGCRVLRYQAREKRELIGTTNYTPLSQFFPPSRER